MSISNRKSLKELIHSVHDYLRNHGAGYGMNALKVFNVIYGLKVIEEKNLFEKTGLDESCKFSELVKMAKKLKGDELAQKILKDILDKIYDNKDMKEFLFYEIPQNITSDALIYLVNSLNKIDKKYQVHLAGKIYEYFIGRDKTAISELGAYFTDRHIVNYIYKKLKPSVNEDGQIIKQ